MATSDSSTFAVTPERVHATVARITAPGQAFEVADRNVAGRTEKAFVNAATTVVELLAMGRAHGDQIFLVYESQRWTFKEFFSRVDAVAAALQQDFGVSAGDRVAIAMRNCPDWMVTFTAAINVGAVVVPFNSWGSTDELEFSLSNSEAKVLVADLTRAKILAPVLGKLATTAILLGSVDDVSGAEIPSVAGLKRLSDIVESSRGRSYDLAKPDPEDIALILYTSGSTGHPKGVTHRHVAVCQAVMNMFLAGYLPLELTGPIELRGGATAEAQLLTVPLFHATGLCSGFVIPCAMGQKVAILRKWDATRALHIIEAEKITMLATAPAVIKDFLTPPDFAAYDTSSLTRLAAAGAATPSDLPALIEEKIGTTTTRSSGFGMTESMAVAATMSGPLFDLHPMSAGILSPIVEMRFVDPSGAVLPNGAQGEIQLRGITLTPGYWRLEELTRQAFTEDHWYRTGDVGRLAPDGFLYVTGRINEVTIRGGENIYPVEIENAAYRHPSVKEAAAFGVADARLGEELALVCYLQPDCILFEAELRDHLATVLPSHKVPRYITFTEQPLPRNASEKIHRLEIRNNYVPTLSDSRPPSTLRRRSSMAKIRRVVTGHDQDGRAVFVADEEIGATTVALTDTRYLELWRGDDLPNVPSGGANGPRSAFYPSPGGYRFFILTIPPDSEKDYAGIDLDAALKEMEVKLPGVLQYSEMDNPGMHATNTVDMEYVVAGEITLELDDGVMTVLRAGDSSIQNGTRHRWHNRGTEDAVLVVAMVGALRLDPEVGV